MKEYKGYTAKVEYDDEGNVLHGRVLNIRDVVTFEATSVKDLQREFEASVDDYLDYCAEKHVQPERPLSGRILLRITTELHREVATAAERADQSVNAWIATALDAQLHGFIRSGKPSAGAVQRGGVSRSAGSKAPQAPKARRN